MSYVPMHGKLVGLGKVYSFATNVPILGTAQVDIPIEQITSDAMDAVKSEAADWMKRNWVVLAGITVVVAGSAVLLRGKKR